MEAIKPLSYRELGSELAGQMFRVLHLNSPVHLESGNGDDHVECNLATTSLGDHPQYVALSYCRGAPEPQIPIMCNGRKLHIRPNLHAALCCLRLPDKPFTVWADAICIDQDNLHERYQQVGFMKEIFQGATEVVVWLGEEADDSVAGMQAAQDLANAGHEYLKQRTSLISMPVDDPLVGEIFGRFRHASEYPRFHALSKIIERDWFSRTWVVQEAAVAAKITVRCGSSTISWEDLFIAARLRGQLNLSTSTRDRNIPPMILNNTRHDFQNGVCDSLLDVMYYHRIFDATDPRDKIYGLGALAGDVLAKKFMTSVDYTIDPFVLYRQVATEMLKNGADLSVLSIAPGLAPEHPLGLPTWAPDWRVTRQSPCVGLWNEHKLNAVRYKASAGSQPTVRFDESGLLLALECCWVDTIQAVGSIMIVDNIPHGYPGILRLPKVAYMLDEWRAITRALERTEYPTSGSNLDAFIQTLTGAPPEFHIEFMREQYSILDRQARLLRWMGWLGRFLPMSAEAYLVPLLATLFKIPKTSLAFHFGASTCPLADRTMFRTEKGYIGLGTIRAAPGDRIAVPKGGKTPLVLRRDGDTWGLRSDCYVHGIMYGEAYDEGRLEMVCIA